MDPLESYIHNHCHAHPAATMQLVDFVRQFRGHLSPDLKAAWRRERVVTRLAQLGYKVGLVHKTYHVGGLATGHWTLAGGQLILSA